MASKGTVPVKSVDALLKNLLVLSRTVDHTLGKEAVKAAVSERFSPSKVQILRLLGTHASQTSSQIARFLGVSKPAVTQLIDSMVLRKLVVRRTAKHDRREVNLQLTGKGKSAYQAVHGEQRHLLRNTIGSVAGSNAERWINTLGEIAEALARAGGAFEQFCLQCGAHTDGTGVPGGGEADGAFFRGERSRAKAPKRAKGRSTGGRRATSANRRRR